MADFVTILTKQQKGLPLSAQEADANLIALKNGVNNLHTALGESELAAQQAIGEIQSSVNDAQAQVADAKTLVNSTKADLQGQIASLQQTFTTDSQAKATAISALTTRVGSAETNITNLQTSYTTLEQSTATSISQLTSSIEAANSSVSTLATTVANNQQATATTLSGLNTRMGTAESTLTTLDQTVTTLTSSTSTSFTNLNTRVGSTETDISNLTSAVSTQNSANATAFSNLNTTVNGHSTSISTLSSSIDGLGAKWGVTINNNGRVTGLFMNSGADQKTSFAIMVDKFALVDPSDVTHSPFSYANGNIKMAASYVDIVGVVSFINADSGTATQIDGARLKTGTVQADHFLSTNYTAPAPVGDGTYTDPIGLKLAGVPFTTRFNDGTSGLVNMELGTDANIGGHRAGDVLDASFRRSAVYRVPGFYRWVCPPGVNWLTALLVGGGGGGCCGGAFSANQVGGCGGGGGGGTTTLVKLRVIPGATYLIRVGPGGAGGVYGAGDYAGKHGYASWIVPEGCSLYAGMVFMGASYSHSMGFERLSASQNTNGTTVSASQSFLDYTGLAPLASNPINAPSDIQAELWPLWAISPGGLGAFDRSGGCGGGSVPVTIGQLWGEDAGTAAAKLVDNGGGRNGGTTMTATLNASNENDSLFTITPDLTKGAGGAGVGRHTMFGDIICGGGGGCGAQLITEAFIPGFQLNGYTLDGRNGGPAASNSYGMFGRNMGTSNINPSFAPNEFALGGNGGSSALGLGCTGATLLSSPTDRVMTAPERAAYGSDLNNITAGRYSSLLVDTEGYAKNITGLTARPTGNAFQPGTIPNLSNPGGGGAGGLGFVASDSGNLNSTLTGSFQSPSGSNFTLHLRDGCPGNPGLVMLQW